MTSAEADCARRILTNSATAGTPAVPTRGASGLSGRLGCAGAILGRKIAPGSAGIAAAIGPRFPGDMLGLRDFPTQTIQLDSGPNRTCRCLSLHLTWTAARSTVTP